MTKSLCKPRQPLEAPIEKMILYRLVFEGHKAWKNPTRGKFNIKKGRYARPEYGEIKGVSDIICVWVGELFPWISYIEVKTPKNHAFVVKHYSRLHLGLNLKSDHEVQLHHQVVFCEEMKRIGHSAIFASSWDDVMLEKRRLIDLQK